MGKPMSMSVSNRTKWCCRSRYWCRCGCIVGGDVLISLHPGRFFASPINFAFGVLVLECSHLRSQLSLIIISDHSVKADVVEVDGSSSP
jgi:hypothetical protein